MELVKFLMKKIQKTMILFKLPNPLNKVSKFRQVSPQQMDIQLHNYNQDFHSISRSIPHNNQDFHSLNKFMPHRFIKPIQESANHSYTHRLNLFTVVHNLMHQHIQINHMFSEQSEYWFCLFNLT